MKRQVPMEPQEIQKLYEKLELVNRRIALPEALSPDRMRYKLENLPQAQPRRGAPRRLRAAMACVLTLAIAAGGVYAWQNLQAANNMSGGAAPMAAAYSSTAVAEAESSTEVTADTAAPANGPQEEDAPRFSATQAAPQNQAEDGAPFMLTAGEVNQNAAASLNRYAQDEAELFGAAAEAGDAAFTQKNRSDMLPLTYSTPQVQVEVTCGEGEVQLSFAPIAQAQEVYYLHAQDGLYLGSHMEDGVIYLATLAHTEGTEALPGYENSAEGRQLIPASDVVLPAVLTGADYVVLSAICMGDEAEYSVKAVLTVPQRLVFRQGQCTLAVSDAKGAQPACQVDFVLNGAQLELQ